MRRLTLLLAALIVAVMGVGIAGVAVHHRPEAEAPEEALPPTSPPETATPTTAAPPITATPTTAAPLVAPRRAGQVARGIKGKRRSGTAVLAARRQQATSRTGLATLPMTGSPYPGNALLAAGLVLSGLLVGRIVRTRV